MNKLVSIPLLTMLFVASGCTHLATHPALVDQVLTPLVPVRQYVAPLDSSGGYQISPDGKRIAWLARAGFGPGVFVKDLASDEVRLVIKGGFGLLWAQDSKNLLLAASFGGDENVHIYQVDTTQREGQIKDLTPFTGSTSMIQSLVNNSANLLIQSNRREPKVFDLYYFEHASGQLSLLAQNPGDVFYWATDKEGNLFGRGRRVGDQFVFEKRGDVATNQWLKTFSWNAFDTVIPLEIDIASASAWALSNRGRNKIALVQLSLINGVERVEYEHPDVDVTGALISKRTLRPIMSWAEPGHPEQQFSDVTLRDGLRELLAKSPVRFVPTGMSRDEKILLGAVTTSSGTQNILYDVDRARVTVLGETTSSLLDKISPLPTMKPIKFASRDGLTIHGYLTLPNNVPSKQLPTVLLVHGGPHLRDYWGPDSTASFLANRGYAVLQINYRGSKGYGREFLEKGFGQFAAKMHDDLIDGLDWSVNQGFTDPAKVAIVGASYGGYAALVGLTFTPETFACAVDSVGISDIGRFLETLPPNWEFSKAFWYKLVGDPANPADRATMALKSPVNFASSVTKPLLVFH